MRARHSGREKGGQGECAIISKLISKIQHLEEDKHLSITQIGNILRQATTNIY